MNGYQAPPLQAANPWGAPQAQPVPQLISVKGIDGARAYQAPPNSMVPLFDADEDVLYLKTVDGMGVPSVRVFDFTERAGDVGSEYATKADLDTLGGKLDELIGALK